MQDASSQSLQAKASVETSLRHHVDSPWKVGAHVSSAGGVENAVTNAVAIGSVMQIWPSHQTYYVLQGKLFRALSQIATQMDITFSHSHICIRV
jgi:hypothetical protein